MTVSTSIRPDTTAEALPYAQDLAHTLTDQGLTLPESK